MRNNLEPTSLILERIPELMGLDMRWNASKRFWYGHYYMDGTLHGKKDKLKVKVYNNSRNGRIYVYEQGGESIPLTTWLVRYGGAIDERDAMSRMLGRRISSVKLRPEHIMKDVIPLPKRSLRANLFTSTSVLRCMFGCVVCFLRIV